MKITAEDLVKLGVAETIIEEPLGGAHNDLDKMSENIKEYLSQKIPEKCQKDIENQEKSIKLFEGNNNSQIQELKRKAEIRREAMECILAYIKNGQKCFFEIDD